MTKVVQDIEKEVDSIASNSTEGLTAQDREEKLLLSQDSGEVIAGHLEIPELAAEIKRAVWQVEKSLKAKQELKAEKKELDSANEEGAKR